LIDFFSSKFYFDHRAMVEPIVLAKQRRALFSSSSHSSPKSSCHFTLTFAQSIDGSVSAVSSLPLSLSSPASFVMTHSLRAIHDALVVGVGTLLVDNPTLNTRLVDGPSPCPIILDRRLRSPIDSKCFQRDKDSLEERPAIILTGRRGLFQSSDQSLLASLSTPLTSSSPPFPPAIQTISLSQARASLISLSLGQDTAHELDQSKLERLCTLLETHHALTVIALPCARIVNAQSVLPVLSPSQQPDHSFHPLIGSALCTCDDPTSSLDRVDDFSLPWNEIRAALSPRFDSVMIEGGATVIESLLSLLHEPDCLIDSVLITVAPTFVGGTRTLTRFLSSMPRLHDVVIEQCDRDAIILGSTRQGCQPFFYLERVSHLSRYLASVSRVSRLVLSSFSSLLCSNPSSNIFLCLSFLGALSLAISSLFSHHKMLTSAPRFRHNRLRMRFILFLFVCVTLIFVSRRWKKTRELDRKGPLSSAPFQSNDAEDSDPIADTDTPLLTKISARRDDRDSLRLAIGSSLLPQVEGTLSTRIAALLQSMKQQQARSTRRSLSVELQAESSCLVITQLRKFAVT